MVLRANNRFPGLGGHLATYASAASLYEVGFTTSSSKDTRAAATSLLPGARCARHLRPGLLEGRLTEDQLDRFRRETGGGG